MHRRFVKKKYEILLFLSSNAKFDCFNKNPKLNLLVSGGKKPVEHHAAVWVPDNEANVCMHCKRTQFTMLVRRVSSSKSSKRSPKLINQKKLSYFSIIVGIVELLFAVHVHRKSFSYRNKVQSHYVFA